jgi:hypothetical protein
VYTLGGIYSRLHISVKSVLKLKYITSLPQGVSSTNTHIMYNNKSCVLLRECNVYILSGPRNPIFIYSQFVLCAAAHKIKVSSLITTS